MKLTQTKWTVRLHENGKATNLGTVEGRTKLEATREAGKLVSRSQRRFLIVEKDRASSATKPPAPPASRLPELAIAVDCSPPRLTVGLLGAEVSQGGDYQSARLLEIERRILAIEATLQGAGAEVTK